MGIVQIAGIALLACMLLLLLKELRPSLAPVLRLCAAVMLGGAAIALFAPTLAKLNTLFKITDTQEYASLLLRALGIALICELGSSFCEDLGEQSLARCVGLFGKAEILLLSLPLLDRVIQSAKELLEF